MGRMDVTSTARRALDTRLPRASPGPALWLRQENSLSPLTGCAHPVTGNREEGTSQKIRANVALIVL